MILLLSQIEDTTVSYLEERLKEKILPYLRLNVEDFGSTMFSKLSIGPETEITVGQITYSLRGIFCKYTDIVAKTALTSIPAEYYTFASTEASDALLGGLMSSEAIWMNRPESRFRASIKISQLKVAQKIGFEVPETLVSSKKEDLIDFWHAKRGNVVTKAIHVGRITKVESRDEHVVVFTSKVKREALNKIADTNFPPILFQEAVNKTSDLRVVVVGNRCFTSQIVSDELDWRKDKTTIEHSSKYTLTQNLEEKCINLVKSLGLELGVIDLAIDIEGRVFFFEVNQQGGWLWMEKVLGFPIRDSIIERLRGK